MKHTLLALIVGSALFFSSCTDDTTDPTPNNNENKEKTKLEMVTEGAWRIETGTIEPPITVEFQGTTITADDYWDLLAYNGGGEVKECDRDNVMYLNLDSTVLLDEGPTKCDAGDPQSDAGGTWVFLNDETQIQFSSFPYDPEGKPQTMDVDSLTETNMDLKLLYEFKSPVDGKITIHEINIGYVNTKK